MSRIDWRDNSMKFMPKRAPVNVRFSAYLTGRELFSIHHICEWCLSSAIIITIILILSLWRFLRGEGASPSGQVREEPAGGPEPTARVGVSGS